LRLCVQSILTNSFSLLLITSCIQRQSLHTDKCVVAVVKQCSS
jgi:hypothetical protein